MDLIPSKEVLEKTFMSIKGVELPTVPDIVQKANQELIKPDPNIHSLAELISKDPVLSGQILKIVNSPYYGLRTKIDSVQKAVVLLGQKNLKNVLTSAGLKQAMNSNDESRKIFWDRSAATAACASGIASLVQDIKPEEAYLTGLFLDTGVLVLLDKTPAYSRIAGNQPTYPNSVIVFEENKFETNHALVGYLLAMTWKIPEESALAILHHHSQSFEEFENPKIRALIAMMQASYSMVSEVMSDDIESFEKSKEHTEFRDNALNELMLPFDDVLAIANESIRDL